MNWVSLVLILLLCHCSSPDKLGTSSEGGGAGLIASESSIFPHTKNWAQPSEHGAFVKTKLGYVTDNCIGCHNPDTSSGSIPSCKSCHANYPHPKQWALPGNHGQFVVQSGSSQCATLCHGADLKGGLTKIGCDSCHALFPHSDMWKEPAQHGQFMKAQKFDTAICTNCHQSSGESATDIPTCGSCHSNYPHPSGWKEAAQHGSIVIQNGPSQCATLCHGADLKGGLSGISCNNCHDFFPHDVDWAKPEEHGLSLKSENFSVDNCKNCHGEPTTGSGIPSCFGCHDSYPHPIGWNAASAHGKFVLEKGKEACATLCHGADLNGGLSDISCNTCHIVYPSLHSDAAWSLNGGHGSYLNDQGGGLATTVQNQCASCHSLTTISATTTATACVACHDAGNHYPHPKDWLENADPFGGLHGPAVVAGNSAKKAGCLSACHGSNGDNGFLPTSVATCVSCHASYPHLGDNWLAVEGTGYPDHAVAVLDITATAIKNDDDLNISAFNECAKCHGEILKFNMKQSILSDEETHVMKDGQPHLQRCYKCHNYPHETAFYNDSIVEWTPNTDPTTEEYWWGHYQTVIGWTTAASIPTNLQDLFVNTSCGGANPDFVNACHQSETGEWQKVVKEFSDDYKKPCGRCHMISAP